MLPERVVAGAHRIDTNMRCAQFLPALRLVLPAVDISIPGIYSRLNAKCGGIASGLAQVATQASNGRLHLRIRRPLWKPAVGKPGAPPQQHIRSSTHPDWNRTAYRQRIKSCFGDRMEPALVGHDLPATEQAQRLDLLLYHAPAFVEIHAQ